MTSFRLIDSCGTWASLSGGTCAGFVGIRLAAAGGENECNAAAEAEDEKYDAAMPLHGMEAQTTNGTISCAPTPDHKRLTRIKVEHDQEHVLIVCWTPSATLAERSCKTCLPCRLQKARSFEAAIG
eukprot:1568409-Amphidinium_carterae.2